MAKGYVLVDIPESCSECQLCSYDDIMGFVCCGLVNNETNEFGFELIEEDIVSNDLKPDWCPIKQLPEFEAKLGTYQEDWLYVEGYSACLNDILGDEINEFD